MAAQVTMQQVADLAGVSAKTVSNVMRGTGGASQATRERVLAAVRELGYRVNPRAAALRSGRHEAIALAVPTLQQPTYALLAAELMRAAEPASVVLELTRGERRTELALLQGSWRSRCDALVLVPRGTDPAAQAYRDADDAVVLIADDGPAELTRITCPPQAQGDLVARHLSDLGRRRAAVLGVTDPADRWTEACEASLRRAGLEVPPQAVIRLAEPDGVRGGVEVFLRGWGGLRRRRGRRAAPAPGVGRRGRRLPQRRHRLGGAEHPAAARGAGARGRRRHRPGRHGDRRLRDPVAHQRLLRGRGHRGGGHGPLPGAPDGPAPPAAHY